MQAPVVKKSSLDLQAPDDVVIVYCICNPPARVGNKIGIPKPFFESTDPEVVERKSAELTRLRQTHVVNTIWRDKVTNVKVNKWSRVRKGTQRGYTVRMPWVEGITHDKVEATIRSALLRLAPELSSTSITVTPLSPKAESGTM